MVNIHTQNSAWNVSGSNSVSAFSCTYTPTYPVFTGNALLPDSFSISSGVTINVSGISNMSQSSISVIISLGGVNVSKSIPINQTSCTFTPNELTSLSPTASGAVILLTFSNLSTKTLGGKLYGLDNSLEHIKYGIKIKY